MTTALKDCPCGAPAKPSGVLAFSQCCSRYLDHADVPAPSAELLMRSRYSAFVLCRADYLQASWHVSTRPAVLDLEPDVRWLGLEVRRHVPAGDEAVVEFVARYRVAGKAVRLHETSRFVREAGRWFYVDGEQR